MLNGARVYSYSLSNIYDSGEVVCELNKGMFVIEIEKSRDEFLCITPRGIGWIFSRHLEQMQ